MPTFTLCARPGVATTQAVVMRQEATRRVKVMAFSREGEEDPIVRTGTRPHWRGHIGASLGPLQAGERPPRFSPVGPGGAGRSSFRTAGDSAAGSCARHDVNG